VVLVPSAKFELKNLREIVVAQDGCFGKVIKLCIAGTSYIQKVNSIEFPFGNYQFSGNCNYKIDVTVLIVRLKTLVVRYYLANNELMDYLDYFEFRVRKKIVIS
jgi:hypothetical protein